MGEMHHRILHWLNLSQGVNLVSLLAIETSSSTSIFQIRQVNVQSSK